MNYMKQVAEMLGLSWDDEKEESEEFRIELSGFTYKFTKKGLAKDDYSTSECMQNAILCGKYAIKKLPWKPNTGELYYYSNITVPLSYASTKWDDDSFDIARFDR